VGSHKVLRWLGIGMDSGTFRGDEVKTVLSLLEHLKISLFLFPTWAVLLLHGNRRYLKPICYELVACPIH